MWCIHLKQIKSSDLLSYRSLRLTSLYFEWSTERKDWSTLYSLQNDTNDTNDTNETEKSFFYDLCMNSNSYTEEDQKPKSAVQSEKVISLDQNFFLDTRSNITLYNWKKITLIQNTNTFKLFIDRQPFHSFHSPQRKEKLATALFCYLVIASSQ